MRNGRFVVNRSNHLLGSRNCAPVRGQELPFVVQRWPSYLSGCNHTRRETMNGIDPTNNNLTYRHCVEDLRFRLSRRPVFQGRAKRTCHNSMGIGGNLYKELNTLPERNENISYQSSRCLASGTWELHRYTNNLSVGRSFSVLGIN